MTDVSSVPPIGEKDLEFLKGVDSPTIANAIEHFKVRDRIEGFIGGEVRSLFPEMPPMVGAALTVTMTIRRGRWPAVRAGGGCTRRWPQMPAPSVLVVQDISGAPSRCALCRRGDGDAGEATRRGRDGHRRRPARRA